VAQHGRGRTEGDIRLISRADRGGKYRNARFEIARPPPEALDVLRKSPLIIHIAAFDMRFLAVKLGIVSENIFCTLTVSRFLSPSHETGHDLGATLERHLGAKIEKGLGGSDWGAAYTGAVGLCRGRRVPPASAGAKARSGEAGGDLQARKRASRCTPSLTCRHQRPSPQALSASKDRQPSAGLHYSPSPRKETAQNKSPRSGSV
jgi:hypothetical protein